MLSLSLSLTIAQLQSVIGFRVRVKDDNHDKDRHGGHDEDDEEHDDEISYREA